MKYILISVLLVLGCLNNKALSQQQINCSGVFPHLAMVADQTPRTEAGTGALFPWANRLCGSDSQKNDRVWYGTGGYRKNVSCHGYGDHGI